MPMAHIARTSVMTLFSRPDTFAVHVSLAGTLPPEIVVCHMGNIPGRVDPDPCREHRPSLAVDPLLDRNQPVQHARQSPRAAVMILNGVSLRRCSATWSIRLYLPHFSIP